MPKNKVRPNQREDERQAKKPRITAVLLKTIDFINLSTQFTREELDSLILGVADSLKNNIVESLKITNSGLGVEHIKILSEAFKTNTSLKSLDLSSNPIYREGALALIEGLKSNVTLKTLILNDVVANIEMQAIVPLLANIKALTYLSISNEKVVEPTLDCGLGIIGASVLDGVLRGNTTLTKLNLAHNNFGRGTKYIGNLFSHTKTLREVSLRGNGFVLLHLDDIVEGLKENTSITSLDLSDNQLDDKCVDLIIGMLEREVTLQERMLGKNLTRLERRWGKNLTLMKISLEGNSKISEAKRKELDAALEDENEPKDASSDRVYPSPLWSTSSSILKPPIEEVKIQEERTLEEALSFFETSIGYPE